MRQFIIILLFFLSKISFAQYRVILDTDIDSDADDVEALAMMHSLANDKEIDFIVLFWGSKKKIRKFKNKYSKHISVLFVDERENKNDFAIRTMKHSVGFPTSFFISVDKKILDVRRNHFDEYTKGYSTSYNANYQSYMSGVALLKRGELNEDVQD